MHAKIEMMAGEYFSWEKEADKSMPEDTSTSEAKNFSIFEIFRIFWWRGRKNTVRPFSLDKVFLRDIFC